VRILAVGASGFHNAEWFYLRALRSIGANVMFLDQYEGVGHSMLTRLPGSNRSACLHWRGQCLS